MLKNKKDHFKAKNLFKEKEKKLLLSQNPESKKFKEHNCFST